MQPFMHFRSYLSLHIRAHKTSHPAAHNRINLSRTLFHTSVLVFHTSRTHRHTPYNPFNSRLQHSTITAYVPMLCNRDRIEIIYMCVLSGVHMCAS